MNSNVASKNKKMGLGRGLGALLADQDATPASQQEMPSSPVRVVPEITSSVNEIPIDLVDTNPYQPRTHFDQDALRELSESIKLQGIIQPITVRKSENGRYQLISGERRLQASKLAGLRQIPAYVRTANDQQMLEMALIENIQRENLNAIEIALSYQRLMTECNLKQEELGERVGKNRTTVNNYMRLLKLPPAIQAAVRDSQISMGHARALVNMDDYDNQMKLFKKIIVEELSVRKVEEAVRNLALLDETKNPPKKGVQRLDLSGLQFQLSGFLGTKVIVKADDTNKGEIKIPFTSKEELEKIVQALHAKSE
ncbi:MAG: ParB/RepB/Spo0J family partition protein [Spirosomataceae bacterium]